MNPFVILCLYFAALIPLAFFGKKQTKEKTLHEFYLAGGKLGVLVMFCTLFATQYSGNTFLAFPGKTYRLGYAYLMSVPFMMAIVFFYMTFAPHLRRVAAENKFLTPVDWIRFRYQDNALSCVAAFLMCFALMNFLLAQLMAMGHAFAGLTVGKVPYEVGVIALAFIIVLYESMGGMRTVAWTDVLQGGLMLLAVCLLGGYLIFSETQPLQGMAAEILRTVPEKIQAPDFKGCLTWLSSLLLVGLGGAMYPQGIQRLYAAKSNQVLKKSLMLMVFMPLLTVLFAYFMGLLAIVKLPGLTGLETDEVMVKLLSLLSAESLFVSFGASILVVGAVAAMMSTADSVLLSFSSIVTHDFFARVFPKKDEVTLLKTGKRISWIIMFILVGVALQPKLTLWKLLEIKFEFLLQVAPAFILGFYFKNLSSKTILIAMLIGCTIALGGQITPFPKFYGIHWGVLGCVVNFMICFVSCGMNRSRQNTNHTKTANRAV